MSLQTINFDFAAADGSTRVRTLEFVLQDSPVIDSTTLAIGETVRATIPADGTGSVDLHPGEYKVTIEGEPNTNTITVPTSGTSHNYADLTGAGTTYTNNDILSGGSDWPHQSSAPGNPASGKSTVYFNASGDFVKQDSAGTVTTFSAGGEANTASNVGVAGESIFKQKTGSDLEFKSIKAGTNVTVTATGDDELEIAATGAAGETNTASNVGTAGVGVFKQKTGVDFELKKINAGSSKVTITDDTGNDEIDIDVDPSVIPIGDLSNAPAGAVVGTTDTQTLTNKSIDASQIDSGTLPPARLGAASIDAITEVAAALKTGSDAKFVTGTAGTSGDLVAWDANGDAVDGPTPPSGAIVGTSDAQTLTTKTLDADSNTVSNIGASEIKPDLITGQTAAAAFASGDKFLIVSGGALEQADYDDLPGGGGGGETNTASNVGTAGVGVFKQKTGVDFELKKINAGSSKVTITDDTGNDEIDIDVDPTVIPIGNLMDAPTGTVVGTTDTQTLTNKSIAASQIDSGTLPPARLGAASIDAITEVAAALKTGSDAKFVTGTAGTSGDLVAWDANGDAVDGPTPPSGAIVGTTDTQTLSGKTFSDHLTLAEIAAPSTPATGYGAFYAGTDGKPYFKNDAGTATDLTSGAGGGKVVKWTFDHDTSDASTASLIAIDTSIPTSGEGAEFTTLSHTPDASGNTLLIEISTFVSASAGCFAVLALFLDSETDAREIASTYIAGSDQNKTAVLRYVYTTTGTSAQTWKLRFGGNAGTTYINRNQSSAGYYGSKNGVTFTITEFEP